MYDVMATSRIGRGRRDRAERAEEADYWAPDRHRTISGEEATDLVPALGPLDPGSAYLFYDCQTDDVRLVLTVLGEAERFGAVVANRTEVVEVLDEDGRAAGVLCVDRESGDRFELRAANIVNATGVWADRIRTEELLAEEEIPRIRPSRGTHVTLSTEDIDIGTAACVIPASGDRTIFVLPWYGRALVGTTDNDYEGDIDRIPPAEDDIEYLLEAVNAYFETDLGPDDLTGAYAGVRPLISTGDPKKSVDISRKAELYETSSGMLTITGGKLTTFRRMAAQVVDRITERDGRDATCRTDDIPLGMAARPDDLESKAELPERAAEQLAFRYGHAARTVMALCTERPELAAPIVPGHPDLLAEVVVAARHEQARSIADVLQRRTRLGLVAAPELRDGDAVETVARTLGEELGWSRRRIEEETAAWREIASGEGVDPVRAPSR